MSRNRPLAILVCLLSLLRYTSATADPSDDYWSAYASRFVQQDGRVVDTGAGGISHSEAEGTAMLLAERHDDRDKFDKIWAWTRNNLGGRKDGLMIWGWHPEGRTHAPDKNNATDGDLLIAWALAEAAERWKVPALHDSAVSLAHAILTHLLRETGAGPVLLPGTNGFEGAKGIVINLSYEVLPAYHVLDAVDPDPAWKRLADTAHVLLGRHARGTSCCRRTQSLSPRDGGRPGNPRTGAVVRQATSFRLRCDPHSPLSGLGRCQRQELWPFQQFWEYFDKLPFHPAWVDVADDSVTRADIPGRFHQYSQAGRTGRQAGRHGGAVRTPRGQGGLLFRQPDGADIPRLAGPLRPEIERDRVRPNGRK